jgi:hypothetical protein
VAKEDSSAGTEAGHPWIGAALHAVEDEVASFFGSLPEDEFVHRAGEAWTPAEHLRHLCVSVGAVARGFAAPRWLLRLRFGRARTPSRTYDAIRETYRSSLAAGAGASGRFVPPRQDVSPDQVAERRAELLARWTRVNAALRSGLEPWSETDLDRIQMPHPILGKLTAREMLFFTLYHNGHHVEAAQRRIPRFRATTAGA